MYNIYVTSDDNLLIDTSYKMIESNQTGKDSYIDGFKSSAPESCECFLGERESCDMKIDVWMLGWLLFEICNKNKEPFS